MTIVNTNSPLRLDGPMSDGPHRDGRGGASRSSRRRSRSPARWPRRPSPARWPSRTPRRCSWSRSPRSSGRARRWSTAGSPRTSTCGPARRRSGRRSTSRPQLATGQLARRYGLPYRSSNVTGSAVVDAQAAYESQMSIWGAVMGGASLLYQGAGWLEGGLTASFEKLILDAEMLQQMAEVLEPFAVDDDELGLDAIAEVGPGRPLLRLGAHARALRDRVLPADPVRLAELRDVAAGRRADRHGAREPHLEAAPRGVRAAAARPRRRRGARRLHRAPPARDRQRHSGELRDTVTDGEHEPTNGHATAPGGGGRPMRVERAAVGRGVPPTSRRLPRGARGREQPRSSASARRTRRTRPRSRASRTSRRSSTATRSSGAPSGRRRGGSSFAVMDHPGAVAPARRRPRGRGAARGRRAGRAGGRLRRGLGPRGRHHPTPDAARALIPPPRGHPAAAGSGRDGPLPAGRPGADPRLGRGVHGRGDARQRRPRDYDVMAARLDRAASAGPRTCGTTTAARCRSRASAG